jgi:hypothetical protein
VHHGSTDAPTVDVFETSVPAGTIVDNATYGDFAGYLELATADYLIEVRNEAGDATVAGYSAPLSTLELDGAAITVVASGFLDPSVNGDGPAFGLWVALADGGELIPLPSAILSVEEENAFDYELFPNPTAEMLQINTDNNEVINQVIIRDMSGRIVQTTSFTPQINVSDLENGTYLITLLTQEGQTTKTFVKK